MPVELRPYTNIADLIAPPRIPEAPLPPAPAPRRNVFDGDMMGLGALLPLMGPLLTARVGMDAVKGAQLPGDVYSGKVQVPFGSGAVQGQPASPEFVQGALGMLDLVPLGAAATVPKGALRSGAARQAARRTKVPAGLLDSASPGAQFARGYPDVGPPNLMLDMGAGTVPKTTKIKPKGGAKAHGPPQQRVRDKVPDPVLLAEAVPSWQQMPDRWRRPRGEKPKKPNPFWQKNKTPSELKLEKLRTEANKKVNAGDYEPYYDVTKRTDVDITKYPDRDSTITQMRNDQGKVKAPNAKSRARREIIRKNKPLIERRLRHFYGIGDTDPGSANWYFMGQLEKDFIEEYGEQQGRQLFQARFARPMAATTGGQTPTANLLMSHYGAYQEAAGRAIPIGHQIPTPLGGRFLAGNVDMLRKFDAPGKLTTANPKRYNFEGNFLGKGDEGTLDEVMHAIMVSGEDAPLANGLDKKWLKKPFDKAHYPYYQEILGEIARDMGIDPRRLQEVAWSGFKKSSGNYKHAKPMIQIVNEAIARTSMVTGMPQKDVVRRALVRAEMPLYSNNPKAMAALGVTAQMLDPEDSARMARARDMGFNTDEPMYHLTTKDFDEFVPGGPEGIDGQAAVFMRPDPNTQMSGHNARFASEGAREMPLLTRRENPLYVDEFNRAEVLKRYDLNSEFPWIVTKKDAATLKKHGFDHVDSETTVPFDINKTFREIAQLDPRDIRSRHAQFDPAKRGSANLLSIKAPPPLALLDDKDTR